MEKIELERESYSVTGNIVTINLINKWLLKKLHLLQNKCFFFLQDERREIGLTTLELSKFIQKNLSGSYLELIKEFPEPWDESITKTLLFVFQQLLLLIYPIVPSIANYLYKIVSGEGISSSSSFELLEPISDTNLWKVDCCLILLRTIQKIQKQNPKVGNFYFQFSSEWKKKDIDFNWNFFLEKKTKIIITLLRNDEKEMDFFSFFASESLFPFGVLWYEKKDVFSFEQEEMKKSILNCELEYKRCCELLENKNFLAKAPIFLVEKEKRKKNYYLEEKEKIEAKLLKAVKKKDV